MTPEKCENKDNQDELNETEKKEYFDDLDNQESEESFENDVFWDLTLENHSKLKEWLSEWAQENLTKFILHTQENHPKYTSEIPKIFEGLDDWEKNQIFEDPDYWSQLHSSLFEKNYLDCFLIDIFEIGSFRKNEYLDITKDTFDKVIEWNDKGLSNIMIENFLKKEFPEVDINDIDYSTDKYAQVSRVLNNPSYNTHRKIFYLPSEGSGTDRHWREWSKHISDYIYEQVLYIDASKVSSSLENIIRSWWDSFVDFCKNLDDKDNYEDIKEHLQNINFPIYSSQKEHFGNILSQYLEKKWFEQNDIQTLKMTANLSIENKSTYIAEIMRQQQEIDNNIDKFLDSNFENFGKKDELGNALEKSFEEQFEKIGDDEKNFEPQDFLKNFFESFYDKISDFEDWELKEVEKKFGNAQHDISKFVELFFDLERAQITYDHVDNASHSLLDSLKENDEIPEWGEKYLSSIVRFYIESEESTLDWAWEHFQKVQLMQNINRNAIEDDKFDEFVNVLFGQADSVYDENVKQYFKYENAYNTVIKWIEDDHDENDFKQLLDTIQGNDEYKEILQKQDEKHSEAQELLNKLEEETQEEVEENYDDHFNKYFVANISESRYQERKDNKMADNNIDQNWPPEVGDSSNFTVSNPEYLSSNKATNPFHNPKDPNSKEKITWTSTTEVNKQLLNECLKFEWIQIAGIDGNEDSFVNRLGINIDQELTAQDFEKFKEVFGMLLINDMENKINSDKYSNSEKEFFDHIKEKIIKDHNKWIKIFANYCQNISPGFERELSFVDNSKNANWIINVELLDKSMEGKISTHTQIQNWYNQKQRELNSSFQSLSSIKAFFGWIIGAKK